MTDNIWYYLVIFVVVYLIIQNTELDIRTIISLLVSIGCVYFLYLYSNKSNGNKRVNKKYEKINGDLGLLDLLGEIKFMKKINRRVYNDILRHLENFLKLKSEMSLDINRKNNFEVMMDERRNALNALTSLMVSCPYNSDRVFEDKIVNITGAIGEKLDEILGGVQADINKSWEEGDIDISGGEVYMDIPKGVDNLVDNNYDIIN